MRTHCEFCGNKLTPSQQKDEFIEVMAEVKTFWDESVKRQAKMIPVNDAFYEITEGQFKGNWVHIWNIIK